MKHLHRKLIALENVSSVQKTPDTAPGSKQKSSTTNFYQKPAYDDTFGAQSPLVANDLAPFAANLKPQDQ